MGNTCKADIGTEDLGVFNPI